MAEEIVLTGMARAKGKAAAEAMVFTHRFGLAFNHVGNEDGKVEDRKHELGFWLTSE